MRYKITYRSGPDYTKRKTTIQSFRSAREIMDFEAGMRLGGASHLVITQLTPGKRRIRQNIWGNWNGYEGTKRVKEFGTDEIDAKYWLKGEGG